MTAVREKSCNKKGKGLTLIKKKPRGLLRVEEEGKGGKPASFLVTDLPFILRSSQKKKRKWFLVNKMYQSTGS